MYKFPKINLHWARRKINNLLISYDRYLVIEIQSIPINNNQNNIKAVPISSVIVIQVRPQLCLDLFDTSMLRKKLFLQFKYKKFQVLFYVHLEDINCSKVVKTNGDSRCEIKTDGCNWICLCGVSLMLNYFCWWYDLPILHGRDT